MKPAFFFSLILVALVVSCSEESPPVVAADGNVTGTVLVFVHWNGQGQANTRVALVEPGIETTTDSEGRAEFVVPAGRYTLRAWDINQGGPGLPFVDEEIVVEPKGTLRVDIVDCLPCV